MSDNLVSVPNAVLEQFQLHCTALRAAHADRKNAVALRNVVEDKCDHEAVGVEDTLGQRQPSDVYEGDVNLRTLRLLLKKIDNRGWERYRGLDPVIARAAAKVRPIAHCRSEHQLAFHSAFERCVARVLYKTEWATQRPAIMKHNEWATAQSEVMISCVRHVTIFISRRVDSSRVCGVCVQYTSSLRRVTPQFNRSHFRRTCVPFIRLRLLTSHLAHAPYAQARPSRACRLSSYSIRLCIPVYICCCVRRIAIFCACLALSLGCEIVVFRFVTTHARAKV